MVLAQKQKYRTMEQDREPRDKQIEIPMFLGRKNQYCENLHYKQNLQIQCDPYQITKGIFHKTRTKNFTIHMETQKTPNNQSSHEKE